MPRRPVYYLRAGGDAVLRSDEIIGIFDLDNVTASRRTVEYLNRQERAGRVVNLASDIPVSMIVTDDGVFFSQLSSRTLKNRFL